MLFVGLGNPGRSGDNHNLGSDVLILILQFLQKAGFLVEKISHNLFKVQIKTQSCFFYSCPALMNISGANVVKILKKYKCTKLIVLLDDLDTAKNTFKLLKANGHRGQNGMRDILNEINKKRAIPLNNVFRVLLGIGRPTSSDVSSYVLAKTYEVDYLELSKKVGNLILTTFLRHL